MTDLKKKKALSLQTEMNFLSLTKYIYRKPTGNVRLENERPNTFPQGSIQHSIRVSNQYTKPEREERHAYRKERKLCYL